MDAANAVGAPAASRAAKLYESLAADLEESIRSGLMRPGQKLPSVRYTSTSRGLSPSTVFQAYYLLEARGLVRARERSGYFVTDRAARPPQPDRASRPPGESVAVDVSDLVFRILEESKYRDDAAFASAFPSALLFPLARLSQSLASATRSYGPRQMLDGLTPGTLALRRQIALRYRADGIKVDEDEIVITNGALEALNLCLSVVTQPGDSVIVESPCFYGALQALEARGLRAVQVPTHPCEGIDLDALEQALQRHRPKACWLMTTFQNPLGTLMRVEKKKRLVELLAQHDTPLLEDDVYAELFFGPQRPPPAKAFDTRGLVMHCSSFSKSLAPGFRVGWAVPGRFASQVARKKLAFNLNTSIPPQLALAEYLEHGGFDKHLRRLRTLLAGQQEQLADAVARHFPAGTCATRPEGGYFLWVELPAGFDTLKLFRDALPQRICLAPGPMFTADGAFGHCMRLNYGHPWSPRMEEGIAILGRLLRGQPAAG
jgi:DNA-binding transcriptional MocR family regulator